MRKTDRGHKSGNDSQITPFRLPGSDAWDDLWRSGRCCTGGVHAKAIASTTHFGGITGTREAAVGGRGYCATVDNVVAAIALLIPLETSIDVTLAVAEADTTFDRHVRGASIGGGCESAALNIISVYE